MRRIYLWGALVLSLGLGSVGTVSAHAMSSVKQSSAALVAPGNLRPLEDTQVHFITAPGSYAEAANPHGINTIASDEGSAVTFTTKYLLPQPGYRNEAWGDPQSMTVVGHYLYVIYCPMTWHNRGRMVRLDMAKLASLNATPLDIQRVYHSSAASDKHEQAIAAAIKIGPAFVTGHGQSLSYDWKTHQLYMWQDRESAPAVPVNQEGVIQQLSQTTLKPVHKVTFRLKAGSFAVPGGHVLAFDKAGRAYFWTRPNGNEVYIYQGTISRDHVRFRLTHQILEHGPGTHVQSMAYNPSNGRLYLVADESIASLPVKKLVGSGSLTSGDVLWTHFASRREFEGLSFASDGTAYLMSNHRPEVFTARDFQ